MNYCNAIATFVSRGLSFSVFPVDFGELNNEEKAPADLDVAYEVDFPRYLQISFFRFFLFPALFRRIALRFLLFAFDVADFLLHCGLALEPLPAAQLCIR